MPTPPIPDYWSAEQALAIYEFLDQLLQDIWARYGPQIQEQLQADLVQEATPQLDLFDPNDPTDF
jgi:hypothetical protein